MKAAADLVRRWPVLLALPAVSVVVVSLSAVAGQRWLLTGDFSHTEFLVRAIPSHPPLIGVAARVVDNGSTPGPSMAYLLWPVYRLLGSNAFALAAAVAVLHIAGIVAAVLLGRRLGGVTFAACLGAALTVLAVSLAPRFFLEPWNVWVPLFAFAAFLMLVWGLALGRVAMLPWAVAVGSHCVQTHISYTVLVVGLLGAACVWLGWCWWRTDELRGRHPLRWVLVAVAVGAVAWLPPVVDQLRHDPGNLRKLYWQFTDPGEAFVGLRAALKAMVGRFNLLGPWLYDPAKDPLTAPSIVGFVLFVALVGAGIWCAWRRRYRPELALYAVLGLATLLGLYSTTRIFGQFFEYVIRWMLPLMVTWVAAATWSCAISLRERAGERDLRPPFALAWCVVVAAFVVAGVAKAVPAEVPYERDVSITAELSHQVRAALDRSKTYQVNEVDPVALGSVGYGLALDLERHDWHAGVGPWGASGAMPWRVVDSDEADEALWFVATSPLIDAFAAREDATVVATYDPRTPAEVARSAALESQIVQLLCETSGAETASLLYARWGQTALFLLPEPPAGLLPLLTEFNRLRQPTAVVALPPSVDGYQVSVDPSTICG